MSMPTDPEKAIETYLAYLRRHLRELMDEDANDIVEEIRAHILDKTSGALTAENVSSTLAALGSPEELASQYRTDELLKRAQRTRSPFVSLHSLFHWATLSTAGALVFIVSLFGYTIGGGLVILAGLKLVWPHSTGLWKNTYPDGTWGLNMSFSSGKPPSGQELLGWWLLPLCLVVGTGLLFLTFRFGSWTLKRFWRPRVLRPAQVF
jgi:hypothetical protein